MLDYNEIDWKQLNKQKLSLIRAIDSTEDKEQKENLDGILQLLDELQDDAVDIEGFDSDKIWGYED
jgi:hypothetical protein